jgi:enoyl-[acyl-carrier protein] reductase II
MKMKWIITAYSKMKKNKTQKILQLMSNRITSLFNIKYPIISGGMVWVSGWRLASAVSNAGGLGLIGAGSMHPETLREHIRKCKAATDKPFGVNVPLMYPQIEEIMEIIIAEGVKIVFTSAGNPKLWTKKLQENGIKVAHVVSSAKFALKCEEAGVDAIVAEGFEAGGHNGREETSTMVLIPHVRECTSIPLIAAGGIATGNAMLAAFALGAEGTQMGTRFALTQESSASQAFKDLCIGLKEGDTMLSLKKISPTRLIKNEFYNQVQTAEDKGASMEEIRELLGRGRSKKGIFEGDLVNGELEIGQAVSLINDLPSVANVVKHIIGEYNIRLENFISGKPMF